MDEKYLHIELFERTKSTLIKQLNKINRVEFYPRSLTHSFQKILLQNSLHH